MTRRYWMQPHAASEQEFLLAGLEAHGWQATDGGDWDLYLSFEMPGRDAFSELRPGRRINHFPGIVTLDYKDELHHFLAAAAARVGSGEGSYDFFPRTFSMSGDYETWRAATKEEPGTIWILKPKRLAAGIDIRIVTDPATVERNERWIVQEYVADPLLLPGRPYKHTLRLYVVVTSLDPLVAYLYPNGPVKFTSRPFGTSPQQLVDPVVHLTNPRVQRLNTDVDDPVRAIDWPRYRRLLRQAGHDDDGLWRRIRRILIQTLLAHREPMLRVSRFVTPHLDCCFELLGCDVLVDAGLRPWLIEVNPMPALGVRGAAGSAHREAQRRGKQPMVTDLLQLIGVGLAEFEVGYGPERFATERGRRGAFEVLWPAEEAAELVGVLERPSAADLALVAG